VTEHLSDDEIAAAVLAADGAGEDPAACIVARVSERGAADNTTVITIQPGAISVRRERSETGSSNVGDSAPANAARSHG
jgi:hypothetical protein